MTEKDAGVKRKLALLQRAKLDSVTKSSRLKKKKDLTKDQNFLTVEVGSKHPALQVSYAVNQEPALSEVLSNTFVL